METTFSPDQICSIAKNQRGMIFAILINLLSLGLFLLKILPPQILTLVGLGVTICMAIFLAKLRNAMSKNLVLTIIAIVLLLVPIASLLVLLVNNEQATGALKNAGLKVGLMGVPEEELKKYMDSADKTE